MATVCVITGGGSGMGLEAAKFMPKEKILVISGRTLKKLEGKKYTIQRSKGLGENQPDMMWETTMNPETRRLISVDPADPYLTEVMFETLLGDDLAARKKFIAEHAHLYATQADI